VWPKNTTKFSSKIFFKIISKFQKHNNF
jgi:hypothetical protein